MGIQEKGKIPGKAISTKRVIDIPTQLFKLILFCTTFLEPVFISGVAVLACFMEEFPLLIQRKLSGYD